MKIHYNKPCICAFNIAIACKQAAFKVSHTNGPAERAGQGNTLGIWNFVIRNSHKTAVNLTDGRQRVGDEGAGVIKSKGSVLFWTGKVIFSFVNAESAHGIGIYLLQKADIRIGIFNNTAYSGKVFKHGIFVAGADVLSSVHKEVCLFAEAGIAGVKAKYLYAFIFIKKTCCFGIINFRFFNGFGFVFGNGKPCNEHDRANEHGNYEHAKHLKCFFEHENPPVKTAALSD